ncbi:MAG: hypothetical protein ACRDN0_03040 [Trebonia sp.]
MDKLRNRCQWDPIAERRTRREQDWTSTFARDLQVALRRCFTIGITVSITWRGSRKITASAAMSGVVEEIHGSGFVVRGPSYRSFVAWVDLFCQDSRVSIHLPDQLKLAVAEVCSQFRLRLPRSGAGAGFQSKAPMDPDLKAASFTRQPRLIELMRAPGTGGGTAWAAN